MRTADAEISQDKINTLLRRVIGEIGGHDLGPITEARKPFPGCSPCRGVLIEADDAQPAVAIQEQGAVATTTEGGIDAEAMHPGPVRDCSQCLKQWRRQHRHMDKGLWRGLGLIGHRSFLRSRSECIATAP